MFVSHWYDLEHNVHHFKEVDDDSISEFGWGERELTGMTDEQLDEALANAEIHRNENGWNMAHVVRLKAENDKLRELVSDLVALPAVPAFDCYGCRYERHTDCNDGCTLVRRAKEMGIEAVS